MGVKREGDSGWCEEGRRQWRKGGSDGCMGMKKKGDSGLV